MKNFATVFLISLFCLTCTTESESVNTIVSADEVKIIVLEKIKTYGVPGIQVCISNPSFKEDVKISEGVLNLATNEKLSDQTQIKVGSITKSFTGLGILLLIQKGLIGINDPISKYLSIDNEKYRGIKVKELLNMYSGLKGYINDDIGVHDYIINTVTTDPGHNFEPDELSSYGLKLTDELGVTAKDEFHYNNTNYILLGMIIESVSQKSYKEFIRQEIIEPIGLNSTYVSKGNDYGVNISHGYHIDKDDNSVEDYSDIDLSYVWSAGAVISTASDLCKWLTKIRTGKVISGETSDYIYEGKDAGNLAYYTSGLINEPNKLWHNGTVIGYHGEMCLLKDSQTSIAVLSNCTLSGVNGDPVNEIMNEIIELINKK